MPWNAFPSPRVGLERFKKLRMEFGEAKSPQDGANGRERVIGAEGKVARCVITCLMSLITSQSFVMSGKYLNVRDPFLHKMGD